MRIWGLVLLALVVGWFMGQRASTPPTVLTATPTVTMTTEAKYNYSFLEDDDQDRSQSATRSRPRLPDEFVDACKVGYYDYDDEHVVVTAKIVAIRPIPDIFSTLLYLDKQDREKCLVLVITDGARPDFPADLNAHYLNKTVEVSTWAIHWNGAPAAFVSHPSELQFVE